MDWDEIESPLELARQLWHIPNAEEVQRLTPDRFQALFNRVYGATGDLEALWRLGGATMERSSIVQSA